MPLASVDFTVILAAVVAAIPGTLAAILGYLNRQQIRTPSGETIGRLTERTHDLMAVGIAQNTAILKANGVRGPTGLPSEEGGNDEPASGLQDH